MHYAKDRPYTRFDYNSNLITSLQTGTQDSFVNVMWMLKETQGYRVQAGTA